MCDEPNSGLDPKTSIVIDELIKELTEEYNTTTIVVTHDMNSVMGIGDYILFLHEGKKFWEGSNKEIAHTDIEGTKRFRFCQPLYESCKRKILKYYRQIQHMINLLTPTHWKDYELIDCGDFEKLERFGNLVLSRPEPQAVWKKTLSEQEWKKQTHIKFKGRSATSGEWIKNNAHFPDRWNVEYKNDEVTINLRLGLTSFKHVGVFP